MCEAIKETKMASPITCSNQDGPVSPFPSMASPIGGADANPAANHVLQEQIAALQEQVRDLKEENAQLKLVKDELQRNLDESRSTTIESFSDVGVNSASGDSIDEVEAAGMEVEEGEITESPRAKGGEVQGQNADSNDAAAGGDDSTAPGGAREDTCRIKEKEAEVGGGVVEEEGDAWGDDDEEEGGGGGGGGGRGSEEDEKCLAAEEQKGDEATSPSPPVSLPSSPIAQLELTIDRVIENLRIIGSVHDGDKIKIGKGDPILKIDRHGPLQGFARFLNGGHQHRNSTIEAVDRNIEFALRAMQDAQYAAKLHHVERGLRSAARGLIRIQKTYGKDEDTVKKLSDLGDAIRDALRTHHALTSPTEKKPGSFSFPAESTSASTSSEAAAKRDVEGGEAFEEEKSKVDTDEDSSDDDDHHNSIQALSQIKKGLAKIQAPASAALAQMDPISAQIAQRGSSFGARSTSPTAPSIGGLTTNHNHKPAACMYLFELD